MIVAFPGIQVLDVVGPFEVFVGARQVMESERPDEPPAYEVRVVSSTGEPVTSESGLSIGTAPLPDVASFERTPLDTIRPPTTASQRSPRVRR